jgi:hypothetical protein
MMFRVVDIAQEETEVQGQRKHDKKREHDFFKFHGSETPFGGAGMAAQDIMSGSVNTCQFLIQPTY